MSAQDGNCVIRDATPRLAPLGRSVSRPTVDSPVVIDIRELATEEEAPGNLNEGDS